MNGDVTAVRLLAVLLALVAGGLRIEQQQEHATSGSERARRTSS